MATPPKVVSDEMIAAVRAAPAEKSNAQVAAELGMTPQYVGRIRRGLVIPKAATIPRDQVEAKIVEIAGDGGATHKSARACEMLVESILLELDSIKRQEAHDQRGKRLSTCARALRDALECQAMLRKSKALEAMTDEEVRKALEAESQEVG